MTSNTETEIIHFDDGRRMEIQTVNGKRHGSQTVYRANNSKDWERSYLNDAQHGPARAWDEYGQLFYEKHYKDDALDGRWRRWHRNGQLKNESWFENDEQRGRDIWYSFNGEILAEMTISNNGAKHGSQIAEFLDETGEGSLRMGIAKWENGKYLGVEYFDPLPEGYELKSKR